MRLNSRSAGAVAALTLLGALAAAPSAHADDAPDPLGPVVSLPFDNLSGAGTAGGAGTDTLNAAVAAQCNDGVAYTGAQWFRLTPASSGQLQPHSQQLRWIGAAHAGEPIRTGAAVVDTDTGTVLSCGATAVAAGAHLAVVAYANTEDVTGCDVFDMCSLDPLQLVVQLTAGAPVNDSWQHPTVIGSLPYTDSVDTTVADTDGPVQPSSCPFSDLVPEALGTVWWRYTPSVSGDLVASVGAGFRTELGLVEMTASGPKPIDWLADDAWGCDFDAVGPRVEAGKTYLLGVWQRYDGYLESPVVNGGPVSLSLSRVQPSKPSGVEATAGDAQAQVTWTPATNADTSDLSDYVVRARTTDGGVVKTVTVPATSHATTVTGLDNGTTYVFDVAARSGDVEGRTSERSVEVTPLAGIAVASNLKVTADQAARSLTLTWDAPDSDALTGYRLTRGWDGESVTLAKGATSYTATDLQPWQTYEFRLRATTSAGVGPEVSASGDLTSAVPSEPQGVGATGGRTQLTLHWDAPEHEGNSPVTGYRVQRYSADGTLVGTVTLDADARSWTVTGGKLGDAVTFDVAAVNASGVGPASQRTAPVAIIHPPLPVTDVKVAEPGNGTVELSWTPPKTTAARPVTAYRASYGTFTATTTGPGVALILPAWTPTKIKVVALNDAGASAPVWITVTPSGWAPSSPTNLKATTGDGSVTLTWDPPAHVGSAPVHHYAVVGGSAEPADYLYRETDGTDTTMTITGLPAGARYWFKVAAIDENASFSDDSNQVKVTVVAAPGAPKVTSAKAGAGQATVAWQAPKLNGYSSITGYVVTALRLGSDGSVVESLPQPTVSRSTRTLTVDLDPGAYAFTVHAVNAVGAGPESARSKGVTVGATPAARPATTSAPVTPSLSPSPSTTSLAP